MSCLFPRVILNKRYMPTKKNGGHVPVCPDERLRYVSIPCGHCIECRKKRAREWRFRLSCELRNSLPAYFVTLTFSEQSLFNLVSEFHVTESNFIATIALKRFRERFRKHYKKSFRHWFVTELGHSGTERIHLHGIIFTNLPIDEVLSYWRYGNYDVGYYCNIRTINYIVKYVTKIDIDHKGYEQIVLCSPGIGSNYLSDSNKFIHKFSGSTTNQLIVQDNLRLFLPVYYRNKLYNDLQKESLYLCSLDSDLAYVGSRSFRLSLLYQFNDYCKYLDIKRRENYRLGYGDDSKAWKMVSYNVTNKIYKDFLNLVNYRKF